MDGTEALTIRLGLLWGRDHLWICDRAQAEENQSTVVVKSVRLQPVGPRLKSAALIKLVDLG